MKRFLVILVAVMLAVPMASFAGDATSRWDVAIGGFVKFDMGYADQALGADYDRALRDSDVAENMGDEFGNLYTAAGETRLNVLIKGPEGWGAKTTGFVEGEFRGSTSASTYGAFSLRHAYMRMQWKNDTLTIGQTWQKWAYIPLYSNILLGVNMLTAFDRGRRQPQIMWDHNFNKNLSFSVGVISPNNSMGTFGNTRVDEFSLSGYPFGEAEVRWTSDACGKIGTWQMLFALGGFYGQNRKIIPSITTPTAPDYDDELVDAWGLAFKGFIPIIPEKKGNKSGALSLYGMLFTTQNPSWYLGSLAVGPYNRGTSRNPDYAVPVLTGGWGGVSYWFTHNLFASFWYGYSRYHFSDRFIRRIATDSTVETQQQYAFNLSYDVNDAMRLGIEYDHIRTGYAKQSLLSSTGHLNSVRVGAWYFF